MPNKEDYILVVPSLEPGQTESPEIDRGIRELTERVVRGSAQIPLENLKTNFESFFKNVMNILSVVPTGKFPYEIDEIEISAEVSGEGTIQLIGGIKAGAQGGIKLKLKRVSQS